VKRRFVAFVGEKFSEGQGVSASIKEMAADRLKAVRSDVVLS